MPEPTTASEHAARGLRDGFTFVLIVGATFGLQFLTLVTGIIMARLLGVDGRGVIALVIAVSTFAAQLSFAGAVPPAIATLVARRGTSARDAFSATARRRWWLIVPPVVVSVASVAILLEQGSGQRVEIAVVCGIVTFQTIAFSVIGGGLQGENRLVRMAWVALTPQGLFTIVLVVIAAAGWSPSALEVLLVFVSCGVTGVAVSALALKPREGAEAIPEAQLWQQARSNYVSGVRPLDGIGLERMLVGGLLGTSALGLFAAGIAVANLCRLVSNAVAVVVLPRVAAQSGNPDRQRAVIRRWFAISFCLVTVIVIALEIIVEPVIRLAFGEEFLGAVECARWLIVADGLMALRRVMIAALQGQGRGSTASWIELALLPVLIIAIITAALLDSFVGVGISLTIVGALACLALAWFTFRPHPTR